MTEELYTSVCGDEMKANMVFTTMSDDSAEAQFDLANDLTGYKGLLALSFARTTRESFGDTVENLNYVVILIIACAAALAFVVLYNLAKINISERTREIATLKVLGFNSKEVNNYINREMKVLTIIGIIFGILIGNLLSKVVIQTCEVDTIMFDNSVSYVAYIYAIVLTLIFSSVINRIVKKDLHDISMVESLKSIE